MRKNRNGIPIWDKPRRMYPADFSAEEDRRRAREAREALLREIVLRGGVIERDEDSE